MIKKYQEPDGPINLNSAIITAKGNNIFQDIDKENLLRYLYSQTDHFKNKYKQWLLDMKPFFEKETSSVYKYYQDALNGDDIINPDDFYIGDERTELPWSEEARKNGLTTKPHLVIEEPEIMRNIVGDINYDILNSAYHLNQGGSNFVDSVINNNRRAKRYRKDFSEIKEKHFQYDPTAAGSNRRGIETYGTNNTLFTPYAIGAHERAHSINSNFNNRNSTIATETEKWFGKTSDPNSPFYGNDYSNVSRRDRRLLTPINPQNDHDAELSESYSDLWSTRANLNYLGIRNQSENERIRRRDLKQYMNTEEGQNDRFMQLHPSLRKTKRALNTIFKNGGKMNYIECFRIGGWLGKLFGNGSYEQDTLMEDNSDLFRSKHRFEQSGKLGRHIHNIDSNYPGMEGQRSDTTITINRNIKPEEISYYDIIEPTTIWSSSNPEINKISNRQATRINNRFDKAYYKDTFGKGWRKEYRDDQNINKMKLQVGGLIPYPFIVQMPKQNGMITYKPSTKDGPNVTIEQKKEKSNFLDTLNVRPPIIASGNDNKETSQEQPIVVETYTTIENQIPDYILQNSTRTNMGQEELPEAPTLHMIYDPEKGTYSAKPIYPMLVNNEKPKKYSNTKLDLNDKETYLLNMYADSLKRLGIARGKEKEFAKRLVAQDSVESARIAKYAGSNNPGNITVGSSGAPYTIGGDKNEEGKPITNKFRNFNTLDDFVNYKIQLLNGKRYNAFAGDPEEFFSRVKAGGYAVSPTYVSALDSRYQQLFGID